MELSAADACGECSNVNEPLLTYFVRGSIIVQNWFGFDQTSKSAVNTTKSNLNHNSTWILL